MSASAFFSKLEAACMPEKSRIVRMQAGDVFFRQGDATPGLSMVVEGRVDLLRTTDAGQQVRIHVGRAGETFAEASLYSETCHCDAVAAAPTQLRLLPRPAVLRAFERSPELSQDFAAHLALSLMRARRLLELRAMTPLTERVLARLADLVDADGTLPPDQSLRSIADDLGVSGPALYRTIAELARRGSLVRPARGRVRLLSAAEKAEKRTRLEC
ncbi:Crp/Fnr family transcriptional regulator [Amorphus orientalis]|uniref:CRP-like cAMP-binding protein n=1 Tax=Amorphus orientalis TaxID=649198 RepID=A0AAE3VMI5_9HYPH|nr:Crp/Fnr family transcriptional regulator [Amorphus orientalis]MDQ0315234.1 CRP-like cAMP-binding protein [Amorphus orientalis]